MNKSYLHCKSPVVITVEPGNFSWCTCGFTATHPICDGAHRTADTDKRSLKEVVTETTQAIICGCQLTSTPPFCDGSQIRD